MQIPPQMYQGYRINLVPVITNMMEGLFGPRLAPLVFVDEAKEVTLDAALENEWLAEGIELAIHPKDQDAEHLQAHTKAAQESGDENGNFARHMQRHMVQMQLKQRAQMMQHIQEMMQGGAGGQQQGGGGRSRPGAQQRGPRSQGPPGMISRDRIGPASGAPPALRQGGGM
jgi:hypothetical protein